jgi:hypothetical protein
MAGIFATAGARLYIGGSLAAQTVDFVEADFATQSWTPVNWMENIGAFGDEAASITFDAIEQQRTQKLKGTRNAGDMAVVCGIDYEDAGQIALRAAEATPNNYAFQVLFNDMPVGGTSGSLRYFVGLVMTARETLDTANNVMKLNATIGINSNIVRVNAQ